MGWKKVRDSRAFVPISITQIQELTGLSKQSVIDALDSLHRQQLILRRRQRDKGGHVSASTYRLRFDNDEDGDEDDDQVEPESNNLTKGTGAWVNSCDEKVDSGGGVYNNVLKETINKKESPPTPSEPTPEPFNPESLTRLICQKLNNTPRMGRLNGEGKRLVAYRVQQLDISIGEDQILALFDDWSSQDFWREFDAKHRINSLFAHLKSSPLPPATVAGPGLLTSAAPLEDIQHPLTPPTQPAASQPPNFPMRWNELVPERPTDPALLQLRPRAYTDPVFAERFDSICEKSKALIADGADLTFDFLLRTDPKAEGQYRWQQLLAGSLTWMKPRAKSAKQQSEDFLEKERQEAYERRRKAAEQPRVSSEGSSHNGVVGGVAGVP
jgi:hypothetical protein